MDNPWPIIGIIIIYLLFVLKIGPQMMQNRKPFPLRAVLLIYNLSIAIFNAYMFVTVNYSMLVIIYSMTHVKSDDSQAIDIKSLKTISGSLKTTFVRKVEKKFRTNVFSNMRLRTQKLNITPQLTIDYFKNKYNVDDQTTSN